MKRAIIASGIPCADWAEVTAETTVDDLVAQLGFPLVLKVPVSSGGRGVRVCHNHRELSTALAPGLLAEAFIHGTEMSIESFMLGKRTLLRNHTRYVELGRASIIPAGLSSSDVIAVNALADRVHEALELGDGMTHMEIFLTADEREAYEGLRAGRWGRHLRLEQERIPLAAGLAALAALD